MVVVEGDRQVEAAGYPPTAVVVEGSLLEEGVEDMNLEAEVEDALPRDHFGMPYVPQIRHRDIHS